jgi:molybdopterin synthase sulfur carrier subunit
VATLRLFASARDAAGTGRDDIAGATVDEVLDIARARYGEAFAAVLTTSKVWLNGEPTVGTEAVSAADEVAVLPPVSGGSMPAPAPIPTPRER